MKKTLILMAAMLLFGSVQQVDAQQRKTTTARKTTARTTTSNTASKTTAPKPLSKTTAFYEVNAQWITNSEDKLYYLQNSSNNAVMSIDRKTGEIATVVPGIDKVYEDVRPRLGRIVYVSGFLFLITQDNGEIRLWDGKSFETSRKVDGWNGIWGRSGKYLLVLNNNDDYLLYKVNEKRELTFELNYHKFTEGSLGESEVFAIGPDGSIWLKHFPGNRLRLIRVNPEGNITYHDLTNQPYLQKNFFNEYHTGDDVIVKTCAGYAYVGCKRRVYRLNMLNPGEWEEYAKIPADQAHTFKWFLPDSKGNLLVQGDCFFGNRDDTNTEFFSVGSFDTPRPLGHRLKTGITSLYSEQTICLTFSSGYADADGNFVILDNNNIIVYNPNNIVGYTSAVGKIIKP